MRKRDTNINQHYVPQFYLRNFTNLNGRLHVYDFKRRNQFIASPAKECYEKYFYDVDMEIFQLFTELSEDYEEIVDDNIRVLNEVVSSTVLNFLNSIKNCNQSFDFPPDQRNKLFDFIIIQLIRTPFYRDRLKYLNVPFCIKTRLSGEIGDEKTQAIIHNLLILGVLSRLHGKDFKLNELYYAIFDHLIDQVYNIRLQLEAAGMVCLLNRTYNEFICSSPPLNINWKYNPLSSIRALVTTFDERKLFDTGPYLEFQTIHLPISSDVAIFIFNKEYNPSFMEFNKGIGIIEDWNSDLLLNLNYSTMLKSGNKIYSSKGEYTEIIRMFDEKKAPEMIFRFGN